MQDTPSHYYCTAKRAPLSAVIRFPSPKNQAAAYSKLVCTDQDKSIIADILTTMANNGKVTLLFKQSYIRQLGTEIEHVYPLAFIAVAFKNPELRVCMEKIFDDYFKRTGFLEGMGEHLIKESNKDTLNQYIDDFAKDINIPANIVREYFKMHDWEGFFYYLIQH